MKMSKSAIEELAEHEEKMATLKLKVEEEMGDELVNIIEEFIEKYNISHADFFKLTVKKIGFKKAEGRSWSRPEYHYKSPKTIEYLDKGESLKFKKGDVKTSKNAKRTNWGKALEEIGYDLEKIKISKSEI
jgi:hypothetical protein